MRVINFQGIRNGKVHHQGRISHQLICFPVIFCFLDIPCCDCQVAGINNLTLCKIPFRNKLSVIMKSAVVRAQSRFFICRICRDRTYSHCPVKIFIPVRFIGAPNISERSFILSADQRFSKAFRIVKTCCVTSISYH
ncbi:hypothetical protein ES705_20963 [subsurface metagenome]